MITVPQAFLEDTDTLKLLRDGLNCVVDKMAKAPNPNNDRYVSAHALTLVQAGALTIKTEDRQSEVIQKGEMVFLPKGLYMISDIIPDDGLFRAVVYFFDEQMIVDFLETPLGKKFSYGTPDKLWTSPQSEPIQLYTANLRRLYDGANRKHDPITKSKLRELLHLVSTSSTGPSFMQALWSVRNREKVNIKRFMKRNYDKPLTIEDYAYLTGRSPSTFYRDFKRRFDTSPQQWIIQQRLENAKGRLASDYEETVTQIAFDSGYENISHFIKAFKKQYNISPKQFQIKARESLSV